MHSKKFEVVLLPTAFDYEGRHLVTTINNKAINNIYNDG